MTSSGDVISYLLETYTTGYVIPGMDVEILRFTQPTNMTPMEYADALWNKMLCCYLVYDEYVPKGIIIRVLHSLIGHSMRSFCDGF